MFTAPPLVAKQASERFVDRIEVNMHVPRYRMSFTSGGLLERESMLLAQLRPDAKDWNEVRLRCLSQNLFQVPTDASAKRTFREVQCRLQGLSGSQLDLVASGDVEERRHLLWIAICRRYRFVAEFAAEVVRERALCGREFLVLDDFDSFFDQRSAAHPELSELTYSTRRRLRQNAFRFLREARIIDEAGTVSSVILSPRVLDSIEPDALTELIVFPMSDSLLDMIAS